MTVSELIAALQEMPPDAVVYAEYDGGFGVVEIETVKESDGDVLLC